MNQKLRRDAETAIRTAISAVMPEDAVCRALKGKQFPGRVFLLAVGKAAPRMTQAALSVLSVPVTDGLVISKYGHFKTPIEGLRCMEAAHPVPDENSIAAAEAALALTEGLRADDTVLLVDDFLANGAALRGLVELCRQAGAAVAGAAIAIEKAFQGGGDALRAAGVRVESLAVIERMDGDKITFRR